MKKKPALLRIERVAVSTVKPDAENVRLHGERNLAAICESLQQFGQTKPLVVWRGKVVAGNGTLSAVKRLKWSHVQIVRVDHLSKEDAEAYAIADNKTSDLSDFDYVALSRKLQKMQDAAQNVSVTGFDKRELVPLLIDPTRLQRAWDDTDKRGSKASQNTMESIGAFVLLVGCNTEKQMMELMDMIEAKGAKCRPYV